MTVVLLGERRGVCSQPAQGAVFLSCPCAKHVRRHHHLWSGPRVLFSDLYLASKSEALDGAKRLPTRTFPLYVTRATRAPPGSPGIWVSGMRRQPERAWICRRWLGPRPSAMQLTVRELREPDPECAWARRGGRPVGRLLARCHCVSGLRPFNSAGNLLSFPSRAGPGPIGCWDYPSAPSPVPDTQRHQVKAGGLERPSLEESLEKATAGLRRPGPWG